MQRVNFGASPSGPLTGVRIADFTAVYSGPLAATILADQGADVVKVESHKGDLMRGALPKQDGIAAPFYTLNRNKKSLSLDLATPAGLEIAERLIRSSDVVMENFRPGVMERLGLGYERFAQDMPKLVYATINGVGKTGPYAKRRVYDAVVQAISGFATLPQDGVPALVNNLVCDKITSLTAAEAVVAALFAAERTGQGQQVDVSMLDASLFFLWSDAMANFTFPSDAVETMPYADLSLYIRQTKDGYIASMPVQQAEVLGALRALDLDDLIGDERFATFELRARNRHILKELTDAAYKRFTTEEICRRLEAHDVPYSIVNLRHEVVDDPQVNAMQALWRFDHPDGGPVQQPRPPAQFGKTPSSIYRATPLLGQDNDEVLVELGYTTEAVAQLYEDNILHKDKRVDERIDERARG